MKKIFFLFGTLAGALPAFAHEGHGHTHGYTITHYFVEPEHLMTILVVACLGVLLFRRFRTASEKK